MSKTRRVVLAILDGFGESPNQDGNAIRLARMPNFDHFYETSPWTLIGASADDVGLPDGQMGNSEVGHLNIGAGRIVYQDIVRIDKAIEDGDFYSNPTLTAAGRRCESQRRDAAPVRPHQPGQRARLARARLRHLRAGQASRVHQGGLARVPRWARHAAQVGRRLSAPGRPEAGADRRGRAGLGGRALLRDGSRQALGPTGDRLEDAHPRRRAGWSTIWPRRSRAATPPAPRAPARTPRRS